MLQNETAEGLIFRNILAFDSIPASRQNFQITRLVFKAGVKFIRNEYRNEFVDVVEENNQFWFDETVSARNSDAIRINTI